MSRTRSVADILDEAQVKRQRRELMRRWGPWVRTHRRVVEDTAWRLVARQSGAPLPTVEAFLARLELFAAGNKPRGSLEGFNIAALAAHWGLPGVDLLARIYAAMEHPDVGWIEQDFIVTFCERNPETADPDAAERMRRMRARKKERAGGATCPQVESVTRNIRNVTTRSDQTDKIGAVDNSGTMIRGTAAQLSDEGFKGQCNPQGQRQTPGEAPGEAQAWLESDGLRIVTERACILPNRAETEIARWVRDIVGREELLVEIIREAETMDIRGGAFMDRVRRELSRRRTQQVPLPLPPRLAAKGGNR